MVRAIAAWQDYAGAQMQCYTKPDGWETAKRRPSIGLFANSGFETHLPVITATAKFSARCAENRPIRFGCEIFQPQRAEPAIAHRVQGR